MAASEQARPEPGPVEPFPAHDGLLRIGRFAGPHGLGGKLRFRPDAPGSAALFDLKRIFVEVDTAIAEYQIADVAQSGRGNLLVMLKGISSANDAERVGRATVMVAKSDLPPPSAGEFYYFEALGCAVVATDGRQVGTIEEIFATGANDVLVVRKEGREFLVPLIEDVVKSVDLESRRVIIEPVPGLLD